MTVLYLLGYKNTDGKSRPHQFVEKVCIYKNRANSQSLSPNPFPQERGYITGATAPRPCRGLRPCDPIFNINKRFFDRLIRTAKAVRTYIYISVSCPSTDTIATRHGMNLPLFCKAVLTAFSMPAQHGTSILTTVTLFISLFLIISVSFSV